MRFGTKVWVERGSTTRSYGPGCNRLVRGTLIGARGHECIVRLEEDDPRSTLKEWSRKGDVGRWSASRVRSVNA